MKSKQAELDQRTSEILLLVPPFELNGDIEYSPHSNKLTFTFTGQDYVSDQVVRDTLRACMNLDQSTEIFLVRK